MIGGPTLNTVTVGATVIQPHQTGRCTQGTLRNWPAAGAIE